MAPLPVSSSYFDMGTAVMPGVRHVKAAGRFDLHQAIIEHGGYKIVAKELGRARAPKTPRSFLEKSMRAFMALHSLHLLLRGCRFPHLAPDHVGVDPSSGHTYYFNEATGGSQWDRPAPPPSRTALLPPPPPPPVLPPLPPDWEEAVDAASGQMYYYNTKTSTSSWERPKAAATTASVGGGSSSAGAGDGVSRDAPAAAAAAAAPAPAALSAAAAAAAKFK
eukprot:jgi/Mesen1/1727/ME000138S00586